MNRERRVEGERLPSEAWIEWSGGKRPVAPDTRVEVKHRSGEQSADYMNEPRYKGDNRAVTWGWRHNGDPGDIVAYRVIAPTQNEGVGS